MTQQLLIWIMFLPTILFGQADSNKIRSIKDNFQTINQTTNWTKIDTVKLWESLEGGEIWVFYKETTIKKLFVIEFGETYRHTREYYLLDNNLSFAFDKFYQYNRPMYWDSTKMKEMEDNQVWDLDKSKIDEQRYYFDKGTMIQWINDKNKKVDNKEKEYLDKAIEVQKEFDRLIALTKREK